MVLPKTLKEVLSLHNVRDWVHILMKLMDLMGLYFTPNIQKCNTICLVFLRYNLIENYCLGILGSPVNLPDQIPLSVGTLTVQSSPIQKIMLLV